MVKISRREFLRISAVAASSLLVSTGLSGCGSSDNSKLNVEFRHGVASGDPLSDKVIIWTRVSHVDNIEDDIDVNFEVATDEAFKNITNNGTYTATKDGNYTVKVDVQNLSAGTKYYYRFNSNDTLSSIGTTKTLPTDTPEQVKMAVFTCANYPNGYFNVYDAASKIEDLDVTIHVGDYIYEYGMYEDDDFEAKTPAYATKKAETIGRVLPEDNNKELYTLDDYRKRYALYHTDEGLQAIHAKCPMIVVWDDHEIANDTYKDGAENHSDDEGDFTQRTTDALQAYFEWLPIRPIDDKKQIFRSFNFGDLVSLHMLETRIFGRDKQLSYANYYNVDGSFNSATFTADLTAQSRTMLGSEQLTWLQTQLQTSNASWQVLGQQVLMGKMNLPSELLTTIAALEDATDEQKTVLLTDLNTKLTELVTLKTRVLQGDTTLTEAELLRLNTTMPYNLDAWDGYFAEREAIFATVKALSKNLVVLAGDTHNAWSNTLIDMNNDNIGIEFATPSVTSPGLEEYAGLNDVASALQFEGAIELLIDSLQYLNAYDRGFMTVTFTADNAIANWKYVNNYDSTVYTLNTQREKTITYSAPN